MADPAVIHDIVEEILASPKYRGVDRAFAARVVGEAALSHQSTKEIAKRARRRLHQAYGAFVVTDPVAAVERAVAGGRDALVDAMLAHSSTAERVPILDRFAALVRAWCGTPSSVADLACGLNPLAMSWLPLADGATYWCCDIDERLMGALARSLPVTAVAHDLVAGPPAVDVDVVLMLKTATTLEQQQRGSTHRLLSARLGAHVVLSMPTRSLGGRRGYADPVASIVALAAGTGYEVRGHEATPREHFAHLVRSS